MPKRILALCILAAPAALLAYDTSITVEARATIVPFAHLQELQAMDFGAIVPAPAPAPGTGATPQLAALRPYSARNLTGTALRPGPGGNAGSSAHFRFTGPANQGFRVRAIPPFRVTNLTNPTHSMVVVVDDMRAAGTGNDVNLGSNIPNTNGLREFQLGSSLAVAPGQAFGVYSGRYTVTVDYD